MPFKLHAPQVPKVFDLEGNPKHGYLPIPMDYLIMLLDKTAGTYPVELIWMVATDSSLPGQVGMMDATATTSSRV